MTKKVVALMVLVMVASLSIAGCTNSTNNPATSPTPQAHDPTLEKLIDAYKQEISGNQSTTVSTWNVTWINATSANILFTFATAGTGSLGLTATVSVNDTVRFFPTTQEATSFLTAFDKTNYSVRSTDYTSDPTRNAYYNATGHYPSVYKAYSYTESGMLGASEKVYAITQYDNVINVLKGSATL
ncbi:MAG: hypothetical protein ACXV76_04435 [Halobacteriota archaeon]